MLERVAEADHERRAARARQQRHMPGRAAGLERGAAVTRPVGLEKARRRQILGDEDRVLGAVAAPRRRFRRQRVEHAVAQIGKIARARREGLVVARRVLRDLALEVIGPGAIRRLARGDPGEDRAGQVVVLEQRRLELEDRGRHRLGARGERRELSARLRHRRRERCALLRGRAGNAAHGRVRPGAARSSPTARPREAATP